ncbi:beta-ketoacyl-ACP synthase 3 [Lentzea jiangxiensis]|uniref:Beta-ketoacyl-[acyl-carrier-protein] synthase III n=1 Tax=Lentzea jiangxiensis TaxID=641025 RepID=A0A1H0X5F7_9PSEU|nr:3-oxoacyl-[acyl-carrier-protein] synthase-3 [Lentzea jiangxiensis]
MSHCAVLEAVAGCVPPQVITNHDLPAEWDVNDAWVRGRTGIATRHRAGAGVSTSDLAVEAGRRVLRSAGNPVVDLVIVATSTPDRPCPATAPAVATRLGLSGVAAYDISAVCTGFIYGLATAQGFIASGVATRILLIGADVWSTLLDPDDRSSGVVFGDGAGAVLLRAGAAGEKGALLGFDLGSDGSGEDLITVRAGGSRARSDAEPLPERESRFSMTGREVFRRAVAAMAASATTTLRKVGWQAEQLDRLVPHQANARILTAVARCLDLPADRVVGNIEHVGNTGAASIPLALADAVAHHGLVPGDRVLLTAFGGGLTWGSAALTWPDLPPVDHVKIYNHRSTTMQTVNDRMMFLLTDNFGIPAEDIRPNVSFDELDVDSLTLAELAIILGKEFGVEVSDDDISKKLTPVEAAALIQAKVAGSTPSAT